MLLTDKAYNTLKWIAQYLLPGVGTLYFAIAQIWGLGYGQEVLGTITAIDLFLAGVLGLSASKYNKDGAHGVVQIDTTGDPERDIYRLNLNIPVNQLANMKRVQFTVDPHAKLNE